MQRYQNTNQLVLISMVHVHVSRKCTVHTFCAQIFLLHFFTLSNKLLPYTRLKNMTLCVNESRFYVIILHSCLAGESDSFANEAIPEVMQIFDSSVSD